ncbi:MAG: flippase-like domain-containing protein [Bacteroidaceae bacterium]|nr:flippase-like domain-containing protein [Bacteroidaceae bacterium]
MTKRLKKTFQALLPIVLGVFVLYFVYRDYDFSRIGQVLMHEVVWSWMALSLLFGVLSHVFRGLRWEQTLQPLGEHPKKTNCIDAIFISYAANLIIPRMGELSRCGVLNKTDGVNFSKALGTVVTERIIDGICILIITAITFLLQMPVFMRFFNETGTKIPSFAHLVTTPWFYVSLFSVLGAVILLYYIIKVFGLPRKIKALLLGIWKGIMSVRQVANPPLFTLYTILIWLSYLLHFYFTFYCFDFSADLGLLAGLVMFVGGTFAVIVPTPNGAGPWHFAVITMMMLYGVSNADAATFALIVHTIQTLLVIALGIWGWLHTCLTSQS